MHFILDTRACFERLSNTVDAINCRPAATDCVVAMRPASRGQYAAGAGSLSSPHTSFETIRTFLYVLPLADVTGERSCGVYLAPSPHSSYITGASEHELERPRERAYSLHITTTSYTRQ